MTLQDAYAFRQAYPQGPLIAGGTDLIVRWRDTGIVPDHVGDINGIPELNRFELDSDGALHIGAAVPMAKVIRSDLGRKHANLLPLPRIRYLR